MQDVTDVSLFVGLDQDFGQSFKGDLPVCLSTRPVHLRREPPIRRRCKAFQNVPARRVTFLLDLFLTTVSRQLLGTRNVVLTRSGSYSGAQRSDTVAAGERDTK